MPNGEERARILGEIAADVRNAIDKINGVAGKVVEQGKRIFDLHKAAQEFETDTNARVTSLEETVFGDKKKEIKGLVARMTSLEKRVYLITAAIIILLEFGPEGLKRIIGLLTG